MRLQADGITDVGRRRSGNEDGMLVNDDLGLLAVADGMGGHQGGEVASATVLESLRASVASGMAIREAIETANAAVYNKASGDPALTGMGTTLTAGTLAAGNTLIVGHVGDSRLYLLRDRELRQITEDHSLVEEMVRDGRITKEQAEHHPQRSIITRALGVDPSVDVDVSPIELREGDRVLICSDGLTTMVPEDVIAEILIEEADAHQAADRLIAAANAAGGEDNITAVIADFVPDRGPVPVAAAPVRPGGRTEPRTEKARRRPLLRAALIVLPVLLIIGFAVGATAWYARSNYYVGFDGTTVTVFRGLPDGLLIWDPTVERHTEIDADQLTEAQQSDLENGKQFSSQSSANEYVDRLEESVKETEREQQREEEQRQQQEREQRQREQEQRERRQRRQRASSTTTTTTTTAPPAAPAP